MSGLLDGLLGNPQSSEVPLLGPLLGGANDAPTLASEIPAEPTPSQVEPSSTPSPDDNRGGNNNEDPRNGNGNGGNRNDDNQQPSTPPAVETPTPVRPRPTFVITGVPSSEPEASSSLPAEITPSALPTLPSLLAPDEDLLQTPSSSPSLPLPTPEDLIPTTLVMAPLPSLSFSSTTTGTSIGSRPTGDAESALADPSASEGDAMSTLMPALPISLGVGGGVLLIGVMAGVLYKKGKWPFRRRDQFEELEDGVGGAAAEKNFQRKWDPRSSMWRPNGATNF